MKDKIVARNESVILREEFDNWALLFDPDANKMFVVDPVSVIIWKYLDGKHTIEDILAKLKDRCEDVPKDAIFQIEEFIDELIKEGLAGYLIDKNEINK